jgi:hypothetical protein
MKVTALLLNWKRQENIVKVIQSIRDQSIDIDIWLWNNNIEDKTSYDVDVQINSSNNFKCWPRWLVGSMVDEGFIFTLDDDIMFNKTDVIENCLKTYKTIGKNRTFPIIGYSGVVLNKEKDYWESKHINKPYDDTDVIVDVIKGRFMFMDSKILKNVLLENEPTCEDIKISSYSNYKIITSLMSNGLIKLYEGPEALHSSLEQREKRTEAAKKYFIKTLKYF